MKKGILVGVGIFAASFSMAQSSRIEGKITDARNEPVPFAIVTLQSTHLRAVADVNGLFVLNGAPSGRYPLLVKSLGFADRIDTVTIAGDVRHDVSLQDSPGSLEEVVVNATRVDKNSGMAFSNIDKATLQKQNFGQDAPFMLNQLPSVVVNSDAGNGVGYTGIRIRGSDGTRINVTINGVPVNDAESQGTFFVNMPDFVSSVNNVQVQRGVGTSGNGAGAFGASINFQTNEISAKPYGQFISTAGSFNTFRNTVAAGTGLINGRFTFDARGSAINSDGYIDRASSRLRSYYVAGGYYGDRTIVKYINFRGWEKTYQAWNLVPEDSVKMGRRTYNENGLYFDDAGRVKYYDNQTDNYDQDNHQLHVISRINSRLNFNVTAHFTKGRGYYEEFREDDRYSRYNLTTPVSSTDGKSDLIRRRWLDNDFAGGIMNVNYNASPKLAFTLGGGYNSYFGHHFGEVIWAKYGLDSLNHRYYHNTANKNDGNAYLKTSYKVMPGMNVFVDLQGRNVDYRFLGIVDSLGTQGMNGATYLFFNPKAGVSYDINSNFNIYLSLARANKEPNRNDFVNSGPRSRPLPEVLTDLEAGMRYASKALSASVNFYDMRYKNQLVLNGQINDVGAYTRINVPASFRRGVEVEAMVPVGKFVDVGGNVSLSQNKISKYVEYTDSSDADYTIFTQYAVAYENTDIAFSPNITGAGILRFHPVRDFELSIISKYVGRQYLDNTQNNEKSIRPYNVVDVRLNYTVKPKNFPELTLMFAMYNVLNARYETNGYTFSYYEGASLRRFNYLAPAAPTNFLGGISVRF